MNKTLIVLLVCFAVFTAIVSANHKYEWVPKHKWNEKLIKSLKNWGANRLLDELESDGDISDSDDYDLDRLYGVWRRKSGKYWYYKFSAKFEGDGKHYGGGKPWTPKPWTPKPWTPPPKEGGEAPPLPPSDDAPPPLPRSDDAPPPLPPSDDVALAALALDEAPALVDLDGDGIPDVDANGDGIPDSVALYKHEGPSWKYDDSFKAIYVVRYNSNTGGKKLDDYTYLG
jgi:hypothetical protein